MGIELGRDRYAREVMNARAALAGRPCLKLTCRVAEDFGQRVQASRISRTLCRACACLQGRHEAREFARVLKV